MINYQSFAELLPDADAFFSKTYAESKDRWINAIKGKGALLQSFPLEGRGSEKEALSLDFAIVGNPQAEKVLLHIAGTHGIEGYLGAAIQLAILECLESPPPHIAVAFLHCLNPWGMSHLRRVTENNIDLNRNFLFESINYTGVNATYRRLNNFLNPRRKPRKIDGYLLGALKAILRYGYSNVKQAVAGGQYEFEKGLFFGGKSRSRNLTILEDWLRNSFLSAKMIFGIEVHSGLGPFGYDTLLSHRLSDDPEVSVIESALAHQLSTHDPAKSVAFETSGDLASAAPIVLAPRKCEWILQEVGTYNILRMLSAFRNENMYHHYGGGDLNHWSRRDLLDAFNPPNRRWRQHVVGRGIDLVAKALSYLK